MSGVRAVRDEWPPAGSRRSSGRPPPLAAPGSARWAARWPANSSHSWRTEPGTDGAVERGGDAVDVEQDAGNGVLDGGAAEPDDPSLRGVRCCCGVEHRVTVDMARGPQPPLQEPLAGWYTLAPSIAAS